MVAEQKIMFFGEFYPMDIKQERWKIIDNLTREILRGVEKQYGPPPYYHEMHGRFEACVAAAMLPFFQVNHKLPARWKPTTGDTYTLVADAFRSAMRYTRVAEILTPFLGDQELEDKFQAEFGNPTFDWGHTAEPTLEAAYKKARTNFLAAETRVVSLTVLHMLLRANEYREVRLDGAEEIREALWLRRLTFMRNMLIFGGLLGGEYAKESIKLAVRETMHDPNSDINYSVIEYLESNGRSPGSYLTALSDAFQNAIKKGYEAL